MSLSDIRHQSAALGSILQALSRDRVPHAYLFHGPEGVGKETLAKGLAQLLLCSDPIERELGVEEAGIVGLQRVREGCGRCDDCGMMTAETHPDFHLIYRQLNRDHPDADVRKRKGLDLGVDVLRHFVIDKVALTPLRGRAKVFVIREADMMNAAAQNALLKTLEEPPGTTFIILLASALDRLLLTTQSRCRLVRFDALPGEFVRQKLVELRPQVPGERIGWRARHGEGSLGRAMEYADDSLFELHQRLTKGLTLPCDALVKAWTEEASTLGDRYRKRDPDITDAEATRRGLTTVFHLAAAWYAGVLRNSADAARSVDAESAAAAINRLAEAERQVDLNANTQLILETLVADLSETGAA